MNFLRKVWQTRVGRISNTFFPTKFCVHCRQHFTISPLMLLNPIKRQRLVENSKSNFCESRTELCRDPLDLTFNDHVSAFKSKKTHELVRAYLVYTLCSSQFLVDNNLQIMKSLQNVFGTRLFTLLMKLTFYGHFVAGEDEITIMPFFKKLQNFGVNSILDYSVEEELSREEAENREVDSSVPLSGEDNLIEGYLPQYHVTRAFADRRRKVASARTYFYLNEAACDKNTEIFQRCLQSIAVVSRESGIMAIKVTALGRPQLLLQISDVIMRARQYMEDLVGGRGNVLAHYKTRKDLETYYTGLGNNEDVRKFLCNITSDTEGILHLFPWSGIMNEDCQLSETFRVPDPKTGRMRRLISQITGKEETMFRNMIRRLKTIVRYAAELNVRIMVDAEQTYFQPAISRITLELMRQYNKEKVVVANTYQCYLKNTFTEFCTDLEQAKRQSFYFSAKLVRGAYMAQERARAMELKYEDPIQSSYDATTENYHKILVECLRRIKIIRDCGSDPKQISIMVASHNEDTIRFAIQEMKRIGIEPDDEAVFFGQLLGMCDYISFPLGQNAYHVYKYVPYGPVNEVLPYLSRRAFEYRSILLKLQKEKDLLRKELWRRLKQNQIFHVPKGIFAPV